MSAPPSRNAAGGTREAEPEANELRALEARRCALLGAGDLSALAALLHEDYLHVHGNGRVTDKAGTLARLGTQSRHTERGALTVHVWGDAALIVGEQLNRASDANGVGRTTRGMVTQTLRREGGRWLFQSLQFTPV